MNPEGAVCILQDGQEETWSVWLCRGFGRRERLACFSDAQEAEDFAVREAARLNAAEENNLRLNFDDVCSCHPELARHAVTIPLTATNANDGV